MRISFSLAAVLLVGAAATARADDPNCLLVGTTVSPDIYGGGAAPLGSAGGVFDQCSLFAAPAPWGLTGADGVPYETIWYAAPQVGLGFWVGARADLHLTFSLAGHQVYDARLGTVPVGGWWSWGGAWDRLDVTGAHVLMIYSLGGDMLESGGADEWGGSGGLEPFAESALVGVNTQATVPEPATLALLGSGLLGIVGAVKRRQSVSRF